jgi:DNA polymerase I-like protein with 3'-5' exonuclease and polymerase domains
MNNVAQQSENPNTGNTTQQTLPFEPQHIKYLEERAVDPGWAVHAGLHSVTAEEGAKLLGRDQPLSSGGIAIPYANVPGYVRIRLDNGEARYLAPAGQEVPIYVPPDCELEGSTPIYVVESPGKALACRDHYFNAVGLGGVYSTLTKDHKLNDSWNVVALYRREVVIVFDAGRASNPDVARAEARLALALEQAGAKVKVAALPPREGGDDQGPDDFIATHGSGELRKLVAAAMPADPVERVTNISAEQAVNLLGDLPFLWSLKERGVAVQKRVAMLLHKHNVKETDLRRAMKEAEEKSRDRRGEADLKRIGTVYDIRERMLCLVSSPDGVTEICQPLGNFMAGIVEEEILDDGAEKTRAFVIEGALASGAPLPRVRVTPQELAGELWLTEKWGAKPILYANIPRAASHLRAAIQTVSTPKETLTYMHSGFRQHGGAWIYLHAGGAVGAPEVSVELEGLFRRYKLPDFAEDAAEAVRVSLDFVNIADKETTLVLHSAIYRAPLQEVQYTDTSVFLYGKTGSTKSSIAAVAQSHWGDFDHTTLPLSWTSTTNAIELHLHRMKDALVTIDDFAPKSADPNDELHKKAAVVFRNIATGSGRSRLRSDCTARPDRPSRALVVSTGEDLPKGESIQARLVTIRVAREHTDLDALTRLQVSRHRLPHAMVAYIHWLRPRMTQLKVEVEKKFHEFRNDLRQKYGHLRAPAAMAHLLVGAYYFTEFAKDLGVMSDADAKRHIDETRVALLENYREQVQATEQSNPGRRFLEVLRALLLRRKVVLKVMGQSLTISSDDTAEPVGWQDKTHAYLLPDAAFEAVNKALKSMNEGTPLQQYGLWKRMMVEKLVIPHVTREGNEPTHRIDVNGDGKRERVLKIDLAELRDEPDPDGSDDGGSGNAGPGGDDGGEGADDGGIGLLPLWRPIRSPAENANGSPAIPEASLPRLPAANAQVPGSCPDRPGHDRGAAADGETESNQGVMAADECEESHSAQLTRCFRGESLFKGAETTTSPMTAASFSASATRVSPQKNWSTGQPGQSRLAEAILRTGRVGLAVRSTGPDLLRDGPRLLALALPNGEAHVLDLFEEELGPLADVLPRVTIIGHDLKLALAHLQYHHGIEPGVTFDTAIAARLLDAGVHLGQAKYFSFENACQRVFGLKPENKCAIDWFGPLAPELGGEVADEACIVLQLEQAMRRDLALDTLEEVAERECKLLPVIVQMELTGLPVDRARWEWVVNMQAAEAAALKKKLAVELGVDNVDNNDEILTALRRLGLPIERTNGEALAPYMNIPAVQHLTRYRPLNSFVTGAGKGVLQALERSEDGRVHATLNQIGCTTGRISAEQPNLLGLPRDKSIRSCITASPGKKLIVRDYTTIELRVLANQTGDERLTKVFRTGGDPHRHTASLVMGVPEEQVTEEQRRRAKPLNFGFSFAMGKDKLVAYARKNYGVELTPDEAEKFKQMFLENYSGIAAWQKKMGDEMPAVLRTKSGRACCFFDPDDEYNARLAFPIQGTAADGMKQAMVLLHSHLKRLGAKIILAVHDELLVEAPEEHADAVKELMREHMIAGMKKYVPSVPIVVEPEVRSSWGK